MCTPSAMEGYNFFKEENPNLATVVGFTPFAAPYEAADELYKGNIGAAFLNGLGILPAGKVLKGVDAVDYASRGHRVTKAKVGDMAAGAGALVGEEVNVLNAARDIGNR